MLFVKVVFILMICSIYKYIIFTNKLAIGCKRKSENIPKSYFGKTNFVISICDNKTFFWVCLRSILIYNMLSE